MDYPLTLHDHALRSEAELAGSTLEGGTKQQVELPRPLHCTRLLKFRQCIGCLVLQLHTLLSLGSDRNVTGAMVPRPDVARPEFSLGPSAAGAAIMMKKVS